MAEDNTLMSLTDLVPIITEYETDVTDLQLQLAQRRIQLQENTVIESNAIQCEFLENTLN